MTAEPRGRRGARANEIIARTRFVDHFLAPVRSIRGICEVCAEPQSGDDWRWCATCTTHSRQAAALRTQAADRVVFAAYSVAGRQSDWDMHRYKAASPGPTNPSWMRVAGLAAHFGLMHRACLDAGRLGPIDAFAVVPSLSGRPSPHPIEALVSYLLPGVPAVPLSASPVERGDRDQRRSFRPDYFAVSHGGVVRGCHVVLFDDTWVTGSHFQSAAAALRQAGALHVTGLVLARRLRPDWGANEVFITEQLTRPYDVTVCPVGEHLAQEG
ncbi:hypothetical protein ACFC0S_32370 [Streptomyces sp. NPDC056084]|uniref:hypothetical protein n=1 Tax=unclassified Streptomyces TaxID=2593676 RepID=UPI0035DCAD40